MSKKKVLSKEEAAGRIMGLGNAPKIILDPNQHVSLVNDISEILQEPDDSPVVCTPYENEKQDILEALSQENHAFNFSNMYEEDLPQSEPEKENDIKKPIKIAKIMFNDFTELVEYSYLYMVESETFFYNEDNEVIGYLPQGIPWLKK